MYAEQEATLLMEAAPEPTALAGLVARRVAGEPLEHLLGWAAFRGRRVRVEAGVFVPRRRSEHLVTVGIMMVRPGSVVVELCCGTAAVASALGHAVPGLELVSADVDPAAARSARRNLPGGRVCEGDLYDALPPDLRGRIDLLVANPPHVPHDEIRLMPPEAREHEQPVALDGGPDGLGVVRRIVADAPGWLSPTGVLLLETGRSQVGAVTALLSAAGLTPAVSTVDELAATVIVGRR